MDLTIIMIKVCTAALADININKMCIINAYDNYNNSFDKYESYYNQRQNRDKNEYKYKGASGQEYQYNLSDPMDKLNYDLDLKAKMNDELYAPITPNVDLDRGPGQYGGGMKPLFE